MEGREREKGNKIRETSAVNRKKEDDDWLPEAYNWPIRLLRRKRDTREDARARVSKKRGRDTGEREGNANDPDIGPSISYRLRWTLDRQADVLYTIVTIDNIIIVVTIISNIPPIATLLLLLLHPPSLSS